MMFKVAIILFIINLILPKNGFAQDKQMMELEPHKELVVTLQRLMKRIKKNKYYNRINPIWIIHVQKKDTGYIVFFTIIESMGPRNIANGFFYLNDVLILVSGDINAPMFKPIGEKFVQFDYFKNKNGNIYDNTCEFPAWTYYWKEGKMVLLNELFYY